MRILVAEDQPEGKTGTVDLTQRDYAAVFDED